MGFFVVKTTLNQRFLIKSQNKDERVNKMEKKKMLPIGIESFKEVISRGYYYVDKTILIRDLLNDSAKVTLFTRPRRFGKSLNMSMLKYFFEIGTDPKLFDGLAISKEKKLCDEYLGKFPVISVSLKGIEGMNFEGAQAAFAMVVRAEAMRHQYLLESDKLTEIDKNEFRSLFESRMSSELLGQSIWILSRLLQKHYGTQVVILIDEYDVPLAKAYEHGYYDQMVILIRTVLHQALKTNESLKFAVLTGCMRIAKESIFTGLNNLKIQSISSVKFDEYFGFTDEEVAEMLSYYGFEKKHRTAKAWYDGYRFGNVLVYCPWDIINYVDDLRSEPNLRPQNYWTNTSGNDIIRRFLNMADDTTRWNIEQLIEGKAIKKEIYQELTYAELDKSIDHLWSVLFTTGYLTSQPSKYDLSAEDESFGAGLRTDVVTLKIPNEEVRSIFKRQIYTWFDDKVETNADRYTAFTLAFIDGDAAKIQKMFNDYLTETISIRDTSVRKSMKENFYHGVLLGILRFRRDWIVRSNHEAGEGYNDIMLMYNAKHIGIIIEVKYAENDNLEAECADALKQIEKLHYVDALSEFDVTKVYKYAIACYRKHCMVTMTEEDWKK